MLVEKELINPNGLTIDFVNRILYWCDARLDRIESINLNNMSRKVIATAPVIEHPFALTQFMDFLFWTDWSKQAIKRFDLRTGKVESVREHLSSLMGIEMFDKSRQTGH